MLLDLEWKVGDDGVVEDEEDEKDEGNEEEEEDEDEDDPFDPSAFVELLARICARAGETGVHPDHHMESCSASTDAMRAAAEFDFRVLLPPTIGGGDGQ